MDVQSEAWKLVVRGISGVGVTVGGMTGWRSEGGGPVGGKPAAGCVASGAAPPGGAAGERNTYVAVHERFSVRDFRLRTLFAGRTTRIASTITSGWRKVWYFRWLRSRRATPTARALPARRQRASVPPVTENVLGAWRIGRENTIDSRKRAELATGRIESRHRISAAASLLPAAEIDKDTLTVT
jgi:hypothetical protein